ncbi:MAG TPA: transposase [Clostridiales bacterium]|nr:transposase [Clostridiales bacterium]
MSELFLFCGIKRDRIKGLLWTGDKFSMIYIRLADGRFQWPRIEEETLTLSGEEFLRLMDSFTIDPSVGKREKQKILKSLKMLYQKWFN